MLKINFPVVGEGLMGSALSASVLFLYVFLIHSDATGAHYLKYISYLNETVGLYETRVRQ